MPRRPITVPLYALLALVLAAVSGPPLSIYASVQIANRNAEELVERYQRDRAVSAEQNRVIYCTLFGTQLDAFEDATSPAGRASRAAWLDLYKLARCQPERK